MSQRIAKAKASLFALLIIPWALVSATPFDGMPTPRVPGFGGSIPLLDGVTRLQFSLNEALGKRLFAFAEGFDLQLLLSTLAIAIAYGAIHALSPGHGKTILLVQGLRAGKLDFRAFLAPSLGAFLHVFSALLWTAVFMAIASGAFGTSRAGLSIALLVFSSLILILNGLRDIIPVRGHRDHGRAHRGGWLAVAFGIGLIPCPISTIIFSAALANGLAVYGVLVCLIFGFGLAFTMTLFALIPFFARSAFARFLESKPGRLVFKVLPILSSSLFVLLGVMGIIQAVAIA
jgi:nickel/cobalt transporter (NicO) family protein